MSDQLPIDFSDRKAKILTVDELKVWSVLETRRGRDQAMLGPAIAETTGSDYDTVRAIVSHLVNHHGYLIASCSRGYYVPVTPEEVTAATRSLRHRGIMILMRAAKLQKSSIEEVFGQARLELEKAG